MCKQGASTTKSRAALGYPVHAAANAGAQAKRASYKHNNKQRANKSKGRRHLPGCCPQQASCGAPPPIQNLTQYFGNSVKELIFAQLLENLGDDLVTKWIRTIPSWHLQGKRWSAREGALLTMVTIFAGASLVRNSLADASAGATNSSSLPAQQSPSFFIAKSFADQID